MLDKSVVIDIATIDYEDLPVEASIAALTLAELTSGPLAAKNSHDRAERLERLQWAENRFEAIPFDATAARAYGRIYIAAISAKQKPRGTRAVDLLIAATALSRGFHSSHVTLPISRASPGSSKSSPFNTATADRARLELILC